MKKLEKAQIYFLIGSFIFVLLLTLIVQNPQETSLAEQSTIKYTVVIDAGHGGIDPGGIGIATKVKEADLNLIISKKLKTLLDASGIQVILTREDKNGLYGIYTKNYKKDDMAKRKNIIDSANPDVVVSIHMNRFTNKSLRGAQTFYNEGNILGEKLATCVQEEFKNLLEKSDKAPSTGDYFMVKCTETASIIAECGYLSNIEDEKLLTTESYQDKVAYAIFCGIVKYLSMPSLLA